MLSKKIGIDLGTANSLVFAPGRGIILNEPSVVASSKVSGQILAVGKEAHAMLGKTPDEIVVSRPLRDGVIADYRVTEAMLNYFIAKSAGLFNFIKPELVISVPAGITSTEKRAVIESAKRVGARHVWIVKEPVLAAIGAGIDINEAVGNLIVNIGAGTTEVAVLSLGGIVTANSVRAAGDKMDEAIADYVRKKHNLDIGPATAEQIKVRIGSGLILSRKEDSSIEVKGRDFITGLPRRVEVRSSQVTTAVSEVLHEIMQAIKFVLEQTPPELTADIISQGIVVSGGGAQLSFIDKLISQEIGVKARIAKEPLLCVARGTGYILEHLDFYKRTLLAKKPTSFKVDSAGL